MPGALAGLFCAALILRADPVQHQRMYRKRDLPNALPVERLDHLLNGPGWPRFEASAAEGFGIMETFDAIRSLVTEQLGGGELPLREVSLLPPPEPPKQSFWQHWRDRLSQRS
ncbi:MAG: hypothetical protein OHK0022_43310 [Roseiflexaceae bacterium]